MKRAKKAKENRILKTLFLVLLAVVVLFMLSEAAFATTASDKLPWEKGLETLSGSLTGPVAGIGFVLSTKVPLLEGSAPLVGIDLDHCIDEHGTIADWAQEIISTVNSYTELSPSGTGVRIFVKGTLPEDGRKVGNVEMYQNKRYLTVTGRPLPRRE